eukprot:gene3899-4510_t
MKMTTNVDGSVVEVSTLEIEKSPKDDNLYRYITLENGLNVLLVSDAEAEQSAASLSVNVGSMSNPDEFLGLAHFLEHMLFLGTTKYPEEKGFLNFIIQNGGSYNGVTRPQNTTYYFKVNQGHLEQALDRFSSFFVAPLFTESATDREVNAVHSEHNSNVQNDTRREFHLVRAQFPQKSFARFETGNLDTLKGAHLRERMIEFYHTFYSANQMNATVLSKEPLDTLEAWVRTAFSPIANTNATRPLHEPLSLNSTVRLNVVPVSSGQHLSLTWACTLPETCLSYSRSSHTLSHLLGHESRGSILSALRAKEYAFSLTAGPVTFDKNVETMSIRITLSEKGLANVDQVIAIVFQYIDMLKSTPIPAYIHEELRLQTELEWINPQRHDPMHYADHLTQALCMTDNPRLVIRHAYLRDFDQEIFTKLVSMLVPDKMVLLVASKDYEGATDFVDKYYCTNFSKIHITDDQMAQWRTPAQGCNLHLPVVNIYTPRLDAPILAAQTKEETVPQVVYSIDGIHLEFAADHCFNTPKALVTMSTLTPLNIATARSVVMLYMLKKSIKEVLNEDILYFTNLANVKSTLRILLNHLEFHVSGHSDIVPNTILAIFERLVSFDMSAVSFSRTYERVQTKYINQDLMKPIAVTNRIINMYAGNSMSFSPTNKLEALAGITRPQFIAFVQEFMKTLRIVGVVNGNLSIDQVVALGNDINTVLKRPIVPPAHDIFQNRHTSLTRGIQYRYRGVHQDPGQRNSVCHIIFQTGVSSVRNVTMVQIIGPLMYEAAFSELRTRQQLGYIVHASRENSLSTENIRVVVQSNTQNPDTLVERILAFTKEFGQQLADTPADEFTAYLASTRESFLLKMTTLRQQSTQDWGHKSLYNDYGFTKKTIEFLDQVTLSDVVEFYNQNITDEANRKMFVVQLFGNQYTIPAVDTSLPENNRVHVVTEHPMLFRLSQETYPRTSIDIAN